MSKPEEWRPVPGSKYAEVSNLGRVRSSHKVTRIQKQYTDFKGYERVVVKTPLGGKSSLKKVHRLVMETFVGPLPPGMHTNHKNGNKADNRLCNLEYITAEENRLHAEATGLRDFQTGEGSHFAILKERDVLAIRRESADGATHRALAAKYRVSYAAIWDIVKRRSWKHLST